jgi:hypothetical protein
MYRYTLGRVADPDLFYVKKDPDSENAIRIAVKIQDLRDFNSGAMEGCGRSHWET